MYSTVSQAIKLKVLDAIYLSTLDLIDADVSRFNHAVNAFSLNLDGFSVNVQFKPKEQFRVFTATGIHLLKPTEHEYSNALDQAFKDLYQTIYIYV